jgi:hypothetical protein
MFSASLAGDGALRTIWRLRKATSVGVRAGRGLDLYGGESLAGPQLRLDAVPLN